MKTENLDEQVLIEQKMSQPEEAAAKKRQEIGLKFTEEGLNLAILKAEQEYAEASEWAQSYSYGKLRQMREVLSNINNLNAERVIAVCTQSPSYSCPKNYLIGGDSALRTLYVGQVDRSLNNSPIRGENIKFYAVAKRVVLKDGRVYCGSFDAFGLIDVFYKEGFHLSINRQESWCNSQSYSEKIYDYSFDRFEINTGEEGRMSEHNCKGKQIREDKKKKFDILYEAVKNRFGKETVNLILKEKGLIIRLLSAINEMTVVTSLDIKAALLAAHGRSFEIILVLLKVLIASPDQRKVCKVTAKAKAWKYLTNAGLDFAGGENQYFDDTIVALKIYQDMVLPKKAFIKLPDGLLKKAEDQEAFNQIAKECVYIINSHIISRQVDDTFSNLTYLEFKDDTGEIFKGGELREDWNWHDSDQEGWDYEDYRLWNEGNDGDDSIFNLEKVESSSSRERGDYGVISKSPDELRKMFKNIKKYFKK
jgi:hypothetical protein